MKMRTALAPLALIAGLWAPLPVLAQGGASFSEGVAAYNAGDYARAYGIFHGYALSGDSAAQFNLGLMYDTGRGVARDTAEARRWYLLAAEQGSVTAQRSLASLMDTLGEDPAEVLKWYRRAADQGDMRAQHSLGVMYAAGRGTPEDLAESLRWHRLSAEQGYPAARYSVGNAYFFGRAVAVDYAEAARWYELAAEGGDMLAQFALGAMYRDGRGVPEDREEAARWFTLAADQGLSTARDALDALDAMNAGPLSEFDQGLAAYERRDYFGAHRIWSQLAPTGHAGAQYNLGVLYSAGQGVAANQGEAIKWFELAAEQGHLDAQITLGAIYRDGQGTAQDPAESLKWFRLAAEQGNAEAQNAMGLGALTGQGVAQDHAAALRWFTEAARRGHVGAEFNLGVIYRDGLGVVQDRTEAVRWFRRPAERGHALARIALEDFDAPPSGGEPGFDHGYAAYRAGDYERAYAIFHPLAQAGHADAQYHLGVMHQNGWGVERDVETTAETLLLAARQGHASAASLLMRQFGAYPGVIGSHTCIVDPETSTLVSLTYLTPESVIAEQSLSSQDWQFEPLPIGDRTFRANGLPRVMGHDELALFGFLGSVPFFVHPGEVEGGREPDMIFGLRNPGECEFQAYTPEW